MSRARTASLGSYIGRRIAAVIGGLVLGTLGGAVAGIAQIALSSSDSDRDFSLVVLPIVIVVGAAYGVWLLWPREQSLKERWRAFRSDRH